MAGRRSAIGIFDSGVGGLTVLKAIRERLPNEDLIYLGDTARLPYGTKSPATVQRYAERAAEYLLARDVKMLVVACNTASAVALPTLTERCAPVPVIGVVKPGAASAVSQSSNQRHLVLATEATTREMAYTQAILELAPDAVCQEVACSMFVALAEEGWGDSEIATATAEKYLSVFRSTSHGPAPDTAILGCTHFPLLRNAIATALGDDIRIVDSAHTTADRVAEIIDVQRLQSEASGAGKLKLLATEGPERFARVGGNFLGEHLAPNDIEVVDIQLSSQ
jgi:glutamate racemase